MSFPQNLHLFCRVVDNYGDVGICWRLARQLQQEHGIDVTLCSGELTLLMGPSGSGKTTLLSILGCILSPTAGNLSVAGQSTAGLGPEGLG